MFTALCKILSIHKRLGGLYDGYIVVGSGSFEIDDKKRKATQMPAYSKAFWRSLHCIVREIGHQSVRQYW